ncbi:MAG TPA: hypothetical protein VFJ85_02755 [Acidimicrobiales bacterium]|nr:hypothetical protein [Acidimicrobiales bacterium]
MPDYWPESCGEMVFGFVSSPPDTSYFVRSLRHDTYLSITGQAWHEVGVASEEGMKPLEGMPWPSLLRRTRPGAVVLVKAPETCVHVTGVLPVNELLAVAMSLQEVQPPSSVK